MSTTTEHVEHAEAETHGHHDEHSTHKSTSYYVKVTLILAAFTALETTTYWWPKSAHTLAMVTLFSMMALKFIMVVSLFMHLKFDNKIFSWLFYSGLILAVLVYCAFLACFQFFSS